MSSIASINKALQRKLKSGTQYNRFFSDVSCKSTFLGEGKTSFGLEQMKHWVLKYQNQTKKIANVLKGKTIPETILNIKTFLYDHIQYSADGWDQNLRSPNCSWQTRQKGIDCKSFSVFAMSILLNLNVKGIKFRKITQPTSPDNWSHVYVVVNYNNKELIIDATVPYNYEVTKVKQEDLKMEQNLPYYGLNAPQTGLLVNRKTFEVAKALDNFQNYLDKLEQKGVSKTITDAIWYEVKSYLEKGKEPNLEISESYIKIENKKFDFGDVLAGLGFIDAASINAILGSGILSDIFGGGTPASVFLEAGEKAVNEANNNFKNSFPTNPTEAFNQYVYILNNWKARFESALANSSQRKTREGNQKSLNDVIDAIKKIPSIQNKLSNSYKFRIVGSKSGTERTGSKTASYNYNIYEVTPIGNSTNTNLGFNNLNTGITTTNTNNTLGNLIQLANGLYQNTQTGKVGTVNQVATTQQNNPPITQNAQGITNTSDNKGMSTPLIVGLSLAGLVVAGVVAKKMNII